MHLAPRRTARHHLSPRVNREVGTFRDISPRCRERSDLGLQARPRDCLLAWQRLGFTAVLRFFQVGCRHPLATVVQLERLRGAAPGSSSFTRWCVGVLRSFYWPGAIDARTSPRGTAPFVGPSWSPRRPGEETGSQSRLLPTVDTSSYSSSA